MFDYNSFVGVEKELEGLEGAKDREKGGERRVGEKGSVEISGQSSGRAKALLTLRNNY